MRRTDFVLSCLALIGCISARPEPASTQPIAATTPPNAAPGHTCAQEAETLHEALLRIEDAAGPRVAPGPVAPWPVALDPDTPTRDVAARLVALEHANITLGSFNVEVPLAEPILPPDPEWLRKISPRLDSADGRMTALLDISREQLDQWEPLCGDLSWTFALEGVPTADNGKALAQRFSDGHQRCACRTSTERWTTFFYALNFGASPAATTTDGDYRVELSPDGALIEFAPDEPWGVTARRLPAPGPEPTKLWLIEATTPH